MSNNNVDALRALAPLRIRDYRLLFTAVVIEIFGTGMWTIVMVFQVLALDDSPLALSAVATGLSLGLFAFSIFGGVVADRYSKRHIIITVQGRDVTTSIGFVPAGARSAHLDVVHGLVHRPPPPPAVAGTGGTTGQLPPCPPCGHSNTALTHLRHQLRPSPPWLPAPGRSESIRAGLDATRRTRLGDLAALAGEVISRLPETGWRAVLFARRDAVILTLATAGLTYTQIAALRICDVTADRVADTLHVDTIDGARAAISPGLSAAGVSPTQVHWRWMEILGFSDRYFSTHMLAGCMDTGDGSELTGHDARIDPADQRPLRHCHFWSKSIAAHLVWGRLLRDAAGPFTFRRRHRSR